MATQLRQPAIMRSDSDREISRPGYPNLYKLQAMAQQMLVQIYDLQTAYRAEYYSFCLNGITAGPGYRNTYDLLGTIFDPGDPYYYTTTSSRFTFTCTATAINLDDDATTDVWTIDETGKLRCIIDDIIL